MAADVERSHDGVAAKAFASIGPSVGGAVTIRLPVGQPLTWNQAADDALGTVSDAKLAQLLGINRKTVRARRESLGIPAFKAARRVLVIDCVVCHKKTSVVGRRASRLRVTCLPTHWLTRPRSMSNCQRLLVSRTQMLTRNPTSARGLVKKLGAGRVIRLLDDD